MKIKVNTMTNLITIEDAIGAVKNECVSLCNVHESFSLDAEINYAVQQLYKNKSSVEAAQNNPVSVQNAVRNLSSIGISLNPALKHAYLVPRDGAICLDVSYMGLMHIAIDMGSILWGQAKIVYENDEYQNQGVDVAPLHKYNSFKDRGQKVGVYCTVKLPNGDYLTEEMSLEQINQVRNTSKAKDSKYSPWNTFEEEMWRKTVVKRASKYWPKSSDRLDKAVDVINEHEGLEKQPEIDIDNINKLHEYVTDAHTPMELFGFLESVRHKDEQAYIELYNRFPPGQKVSGKKKLNEGKSQFYDYLEIFKDGEELAIDEAKQELTEIELAMIEKALK